MSREPSVLVVGAGILGTLVTEHLSSVGRVVCVGLKEVPGGGPATDTQRNQAWLQSGMLYPRNPEVALRLRLDGQYLMRRYRMPVDTGSGVFAFDAARPEPIRQAERLAAELRILQTFREISDERALRELGPLFIEGRRYYRVPDAPFDEAALLDRAREDAEFRGAQFRLVRRPAEFRVNGERVSVEVDDHTLNPDLVVACLGFGTRRLAHDLDLHVEFRVSRSVLFSVDDRPMPEVDLLADRALDLSVVQHGSRVIYGNGGRVVLDGELVRRVSVEEQDAVLDLLPETARKRYTANSGKWTAGFKTEQVAGTVSHSILTPRDTGLRNLVIAVPGKATAAAAVASEIATAARSILGRPSRGRSQPSDGPILGGSHPSTVALHFQEEYDSHNDADPRQEDSQSEGPRPNG